MKNIYKCCFCKEKFPTPLKRMLHIQERKPNFANRCRLAGGRMLLDTLYNAKKGEKL